MKSTLLLGGMVLAAGLYAGENPIYSLYSDNIVFADSFDSASSDADLACGNGKALSTQIEPEFCAGVFGKALAKGCIHYDAAANFDFVSPGSAVLWVAPQDWPREQGNLKYEPGFQVFHAWNAKGDPELIISKLGGQPWNCGNFNTYIQSGYGAGKLYCCMIYNAACCSTWPNGEWKMLAATWGNGSFSMSVNGEPSVRVLLDEPIKTQPEQLVVGSPGPLDFRILIDELVILNRRLSDQEIAELYNESIKVINTHE